MMSTLLLDGAASPMYRALIETNMGSDYAASTGYDRTARSTNVSVGLQGIRAEDVSKVCTIFFFYRGGMRWIDVLVLVGGDGD
jgi:Zn-dependent M16 (insulinase) family peptidase